MNRFKGQVCLVTASTQGIGFAIAKRFLEEGAEAVHICSRKKKNVDQSVETLKQYGNVIGHVCNVGKQSERQQMLDII